MNTTHNKLIASSVTNYINSNLSATDQLIDLISNDLCTHENLSLSENDMDTMKQIIKVGLCYCINSFTLNKFPVMVDDKTGYHTIINGLISGVIRIKKKNHISKLLIDLVTGLYTDYDYKKFEVITYMFCLSFDRNKYYEILNVIHAEILKGVNYAKN